MKRTISPWIAAASIVFIASVTLNAASRPRYGGTLRVEISATLNNLDPADIPAVAAELAAKARLIPSVFETLVRLDESGKPQPCLATSWTHDATRKRWVFSIRSNVRLHNGTPWLPPGGVIEAPDDKPIDQILREMSRPWNAIVVREADGSLVGTGPFRINRWESQKSATLAANETYWNGRPYLDTVEIQMGRDLRTEQQDLELGKADVIEGALGSASTPPDQVIALAFEPRVSAAVREAISLAIDRETIRRVLLKDRGQISAALLPQWLSGYSFLFAAARDVPRARQLATAAGPLSFGYDRQDTALRAIGERISVNAMEAGIALRPAAGMSDVRLLVLPVASRDELSVLADFEAILKAPPISNAIPYDAEKALLDGFRAVPLFHVTRGWATSSKLENWPDLPNVWIRKP